MSNIKVKNAQTVEPQRVDRRIKCVCLWGGGGGGAPNDLF